ncbi:MAG: DMT family transporter [Nitrososphaerales archaeon]
METSIQARTTRRGLILVVLAGMAWGTSGVATKAIYSLADVSPVMVAAFRLALGAPLLLVALRVASGGLGVPVERRDTGLLLAVGAALGISQACYFGAISQVGVAVATLVTICTAPVLVGLFGAALLRERLTRAMVVALALALLGTALLVGIHPGDAGTQGDKAVQGVLLALGAALCFAVFILGSRALAHRYHPLQSITIAVAIGGGLLLVVSALTTGVTLSYPAPVWALFLYLGLVPTALGYGLFYHGVKHATAAEASIASLAEPLTATLLAMVLYGERLGPLGWVGAALLIGVLVFLYRGGGRDDSR